MEDDFMLMEDMSIPDRDKASHSSSIKWVVYFILLFLVPTLVVAAVLSNHIQIGWLGIDIVLCILTALFCTLVAVYLTLAGCREQSHEMEKNLQSVAMTLATIRDEGAQLNNTTGA